MLAWALSTMNALRLDFMTRETPAALIAFVIERRTMLGFFSAASAKY